MPVAVDHAHEDQSNIDVEHIGGDGEGTGWCRIDPVLTPRKPTPNPRVSGRPREPWRYPGHRPRRPGREACRFGLRRVHPRQKSRTHPECEKWDCITCRHGQPSGVRALPSQYSCSIAEGCPPAPLWRTRYGSVASPVFVLEASACPERRKVLKPGSPWTTQGCQGSLRCRMSLLGPRLQWSRCSGEAEP